MSACPSDDDLTAFLRDPLVLHLNERLSPHFLTCADCRKRLAHLAHVAEKGVGQRKESTVHPLAQRSS